MTPRTLSEVLDDIAVATKWHRIVVFADDWRRCSPAELSFLLRLIVQAKDLSFASRDIGGSCQVVLGHSGTPAYCEDKVREVEQATDVRVTLDAFRAEAMTELIEGAFPGLNVTKAGQSAIHEAGRGNVGRCIDLLSFIGEGRVAEVAETSWVLRRLDEFVGRESGTARREPREVSRLREADGGSALLALAYYGDAIP
ncbi:MAG: hypothetical protein ACREOG_18395, partial [Gemmatimonadaceae bacterium]